MSEEDIQPMAPGLLQAYAPEEADEMPDPRRRRRNQDDPIANLRKWEPRTRLGAAVMAGKIITYEAALASGLPIREVEIVDALIPDLEDEVIDVNMVQRMTDSGRRVRFNVMACVGNRNGYVGLGMAKAKEVATAIRKAITAAKLNLISVQRGNGSWESSPGPGNTVPVQGQRSCRLNPCDADASGQRKGPGHRSDRQERSSARRHRGRAVPYQRTDPHNHQLRRCHIQCVEEHQHDPCHQRPA